MRLHLTNVFCVSLLSCFLSSHAFGQQAEIPAVKENFHLFLLIGQSNMAGRGTLTEADKIPDSKIWMFNKQNKWVPAVDPLHFDKPKIVGVGLGRSFAAEVAKANPDAEIGLIPCAVGGSAIATWQEGGYHASTKTHPYDDMLRRLHVAMQSGTLKAILWHQGESDSKAKLSTIYETKLHALIARLRTESGDPTVPFIAGQLGQFKERPWNEDRKRVNAAHEALTDKIPHTRFVRSDGLTHKGDETHFDRDSYRELGRRYAKAHLKPVTQAATPANE